MLNFIIPSFPKSFRAQAVPKQSVSHRRLSYLQLKSCFGRESLSQPLANKSLYDVLGLPNDPDPKTLSTSELRKAYLTQAKRYHPDAATTNSSEQFDAVAQAWEVLSDERLRRVYDTAGNAGLQAILSVEQRAHEVSERFGNMPGEQLDMLSDTGQLVGTLLSAAPAQYTNVSEQEDSSDTTADGAVQDACPQSVEEAIWNVEHHADRSVRYYTLWWLYKFKVARAEHALVRVLRTAREQTASGGFALRRRAALALGAVAAPPTCDNTDAILALEDAFRTDDYFLRYRSAEAIANIAYRSSAVLRQIQANSKTGQRSDSMKSDIAFPEIVVGTLMETLRHGADKMRAREENRSGFGYQESLFDLDAMAPDVRARLETIFKQRRQNEQLSRRTTMTPQLGVDRVGTQGDDEPYEWIIKAASAIFSLPNSSCKPIDTDVDVIAAFAKHDVPLVRYAACKALYALTSEVSHANQIVQALEYGVEHHYSQRVLIRDLGDLGFWQGAQAVAQCPMVENSFKILALKNMLAKLDHNPDKSEVRQVLAHMDSLL